ncbi:MAG: hypothetical protein M3Q58_14210 [Bacteroidota bacterium]|nr:hypothetical protein [Bacteroidota bacterium]
MKAFILILFLAIISNLFSLAQQTPSEADPPNQNEQDLQNEQERIFEESIPDQEPQKFDPKQEVDPYQEKTIPPEKLNKQEQGPDHFKYAEPITLNELPEAILSDLNQGYFNEWNITELYKAEYTEEIPAEYIVKVEKDLIFMYLFYTADGQLLVQERED